MGIRGKLVALTLGIAVLAAIVFDGYVVQTLGAELSAQAEDELASRTALVAAAAAKARDLSTEAPALATELARRAGARVTLIDPSGRVRGDSAVAAERLGELEDHAMRPEVVSARRSGTGSSERVSATTRTRLRYAAERLARSDGPWIVRLAFAPVAIDHALLTARRRVAEGTLLAIGVSVAVALLGSRALSERLLYLAEVAKAMRTDLTRRARVVGSDEVAQLGAALDDLVEGLESSRRELGGAGDRFGAVLESMREGVLVTDERGDIALVNTALAELLGVGRDAVGRSPIEVLRCAALHELLAEVATTRAPAAREVELPARAGAPRAGVVHVLVNAAPLSTQARPRSIGGVVAVFFDVTEQRRIDSMRRDFIANASHELRTPVAAICASSETLLGGALNDAQAARDFAEVIDRHAARLHRLVEELLDLSSIEARRRPLVCSPVDLGAQVEAAVSLLRGRADEKQTVLATDIAPGTRVEADARALDQILTNLVENAICHTPPGSRIEVRGRTAGAWVVLEVEDDGPGIAHAHQARIFERFYRIDPGRSRASGGTGLGLSIVKHLVEGMDGNISVGRGALGGALFQVTLRAGRA